MTDGPPSAGLPRGTTLHAGPGLRRFDDGRLLLGGAPTRILRLRADAAARFRGGALTNDDEASARLAERLLDAGVAHPDPRELPEIPRDALTVVIPTLGRSDTLAELLRGLRGLAVIVVDDGTPDDASADGAAALARVVAEGGATLLRLPENTGPASARNAGLRAARTPFVAFVDSDAAVTADALAMLLRHFADPGLALVAPRIVGSAVDENWIRRYENARSSLDLGARTALVRPRGVVSWVSSTCVVARVAALADADDDGAAGFGEGMRVAEDVDLVWRLHAAGWRIRYEARVQATHRHRRGLREWLARKAFYGTGAAPLAERHPHAIVPAVLNPWSLVVAAALVAARSWSLPVAIGATLFAGFRLAARIPGPRSVVRRMTARLVAEGLFATGMQLSALALRHWWPVGVALALVSRRARILIGVAAVADAVIEHRRLRVRQGFLPFMVARRLDDLAYGAGVWWGCVRARSFRALVPDLMPGSGRTPARPPRAVSPARTDRDA